MFGLCVTGDSARKNKARFLTPNKSEAIQLPIFTLNKKMIPSPLFQQHTIYLLID